jgi:hypothetical protein
MPIFRFSASNKSFEATYYLWFGFQAAFPDYPNVPTLFSKYLLHFSVPLSVSLYLAHPEVAVGARTFCTAAVSVTVPEAPIHEYDSFFISNYEIGFPKNGLYITSVMYTKGTEHGSNGFLRFCPFSLDTGHYFASLLRREDVGHGPHFFPNYYTFDFWSVENMVSIQ